MNINNKKGKDRLCGYHGNQFSVDIYLSEIPLSHQEGVGEEKKLRNRMETEQDIKFLAALMKLDKAAKRAEKHFSELGRIQTEHPQPSPSFLSFFLILLWGVTSVG
ncbi:hypothetical protein CEXT_268431 [Caerostris extrusa]|uniref:Uncharacterized protein n=1 Tax=Caerostris extrusa TaxID=172846 RepID=A0AAV4SVS0_CAEEX|nr:hypothetical protein CEXT_268431 [Caerostris extrusa]